MARAALPELWDEVHHPEQPQRTVAEVWSDERAHLMRMPAPFDGFVEHTKRVSPDLPYRLGA